MAGILHMLGKGLLSLGLIELNYGALEVPRVRKRLVPLTPPLPCPVSSLGPDRERGTYM